MDRRGPIDRISMLQDELLVYILSFLTLKEATATSILSCRWRYLWTFTPKLDFDGTESLLKIPFGKGGQGLLDNERQKYVRWVNYGVATHADSTIDEFRVFFNLNKTHQICIDKWLGYVLARKVQRLELNLTHHGNTSFPKDDYYTFPYQLLCTEKGNFSIYSGSLSMGSYNSIDFKYLRKISMNFVNVNGEALEFFLCNCPLLEDLSVSQSAELSSLRIIGPFPSFKRLEISSCRKLNSVEIRDSNLVYLKYIGRRIHFLLENVPNLVEIFVAGYMDDILALFSSYLPQLKIFTMEAKDLLSWEKTEFLYSAVKMSNLKQLVVRVCTFKDNSLLPLTNLIRASPCLERFVVKASQDFNPETLKGKILKIGRSYVNLKEVEFLGYCGMRNELELVMHFLENGVALEKIIIDPQLLWNTPFEYMRKYKWEENIEVEMDARNRAKQQLIEIVPPRINLEIL